MEAAQNEVSNPILQKDRSVSAQRVELVLQKIRIQSSVRDFSDQISAEAEHSDREAEENERQFEDFGGGSEGEAVSEFGHETEGELLNVALEDYDQKITPKVKLAQHFGQSEVEEHSEEYSEDNESNKYDWSIRKEEIGVIRHHSLNSFRTFYEVLALIK
jgi:hypothetical protein